MKYLPSSQLTHYCDNYAVNALLMHYAAICQQKKIALEIQGNIPSDCGSIADSDLIVIIGNILENAVEACEKLNGKREISFHAGVHGEMLMITCRNPYHPSSVHLKNGQFLSSKRPAYGTGTRSIRSMAQKYHGEADFQILQKFTVRVYLDMQAKEKL